MVVLSIFILQKSVVAIFNWNTNYKTDSCQLKFKKVVCFGRRMLKKTYAPYVVVYTDGSH